MKMQVCIVGGGFSGLTLGYFLVKKGLSVEIYEKHRWGGLLHTRVIERSEGFIYVEEAANGLLNSEDVEEMFKDLGVNFAKSSPSSRKRFIYVDGKLSRWPLGVLASFKFLGFLLLFFICKNRVKPKKMETIQEWCLRVLNKDILDKLVAPALQGVYAGDPQLLSASLILESLFSSHQKDKTSRGTVAPEKGLGQLVLALRDFLKEKGTQFYEQEYSLEFHHQPRDKAVVFAGSLAEFNQFSKFKLEQEMLSLVRVDLAFRKSSIPGFGVLFPRSSGVRALGVLANTKIFSRPKEIPHESWIYGGALDSKVLALNERELIELALQDRQKLLGITEEPLETQVISWKDVLPHYSIAFERSLLEIQDFVCECSGKGIYFSGNFWGDLGLAKILKRNRKLSQLIFERINP